LDFGTVRLTCRAKWVIDRIYVARVRSTSVRGEEIFARDENVILPRTRLHSVSHLGMFSLFPFFVNRARVMKHSRRKHQRSAGDIRQDEVSAENLPVAHILHCREKVSAGESRNRLRRKNGLCSSSTRGRNLGCYPGNVMIQRRELDRESADASGTHPVSRYRVDRQNNVDERF